MALPVVMSLSEVYRLSEERHQQNVCSYSMLRLPWPFKQFREEEVVREVLCLLRCLPSSLFELDLDGHYRPNLPIEVKSMTPGPLHHMMDNFARLGDTITFLHTLVTHVHRLTNSSLSQSSLPSPSLPLSPSQPAVGEQGKTSPTTNDKGVFAPLTLTLVLQAFSSCVQQYLDDISCQLTKLDHFVTTITTISSNNNGKDARVSLIMLHTLSSSFRPHLCLLESLVREWLASMYNKGDGGVPSGGATAQASLLLSVLYRSLRIEAVSSVSSSSGHAATSAAALPHRTQHPSSSSSSSILPMMMYLFVTASRPYIDILDTWVTHGTLQDPYGEVFLKRNTEMSVHSLEYWNRGVWIADHKSSRGGGEESQANANANANADDAFTLVPEFLGPVCQHILRSGKALNALNDDTTNAVRRHRGNPAPSSSSSAASPFLPTTQKTSLFDEFHAGIATYMSSLTLCAVTTSPASTPTLSSTTAPAPAPGPSTSTSSSDTTWNQPIFTTSLQPSTRTTFPNNAERTRRDHSLLLSESVFGVSTRLLVADLGGGSGATGDGGLFGSVFDSAPGNGGDDTHGDAGLLIDIPVDGMLHMRACEVTSLVHNGGLRVEKPLKNKDDGEQHGDRPREHQQQRTILCNTPFSEVIHHCLHRPVVRRYLEVSQYFLSLLIEKKELLHHLRALQSFFFMQLGEVFHDFCRQLFRVEVDSRDTSIRQHHRSDEDSLERIANTLFRNALYLEDSRTQRPIATTPTPTTAVSERNDESTAPVVASIAPAPANDPLYGQHLFSFEVEVESDVREARRRLPLDSFRLLYRCAWPLDIVINDECLEVYQSTFVLLLHIRRSKFAVIHAVVGDSGGVGRRVPSLHPHIHRLFVFRSTLLHFVNTIEHYIVNLALSSHDCASFLDHISPASSSSLSSEMSLEYVCELHTSFLNTIRDRTFHNPNAALVLGAVKRLLSLCVEFCDVSAALVKAVMEDDEDNDGLAGDGGDDDDDESGEDDDFDDDGTGERRRGRRKRILSKVTHLRERFEQDRRLLLIVLKNLVKQKQTPHLEDLLLRLDAR